MERVISDADAGRTWPRPAGRIVADQCPDRRGRGGGIRQLADAVGRPRRDRGGGRMTVLEKKICMMGAPGVGKTSLVRRFVDSVFSEKYLSTIGVKIDKKSVELGGYHPQPHALGPAGRGALSVGPAAVPAGRRGLHPRRRRHPARDARDRHRPAGERGRPGRGSPFILCLNKADLWGQWAHQRHPAGVAQGARAGPCSRPAPAPAKAWRRPSPLWLARSSTTGPEPASGVRNHGPDPGTDRLSTQNRSPPRPAKPSVPQAL